MSSRNTGINFKGSWSALNLMFRKKVEEHEFVLNKKLNWLKEESKMLAQKRKDFIVLKEKSEEIKDPNVHRAIQKTEDELNQVGAYLFPVILIIRGAFSFWPPSLYCPMRDSDQMTIIKSEAFHFIL